jgi:MFS family permease
MIKVLHTVAPPSFSEQGIDHIVLGVMGGVNNAKHYIDLMGFGYVDEKTGNPVVTNSLLQGGIVSVYYLGTLFGCLFGGWIGDKIGRIKTIAVGAGWAIFGAALQSSAMNHNWMIGGA